MNASDGARPAALEELDVLYTPAEERFERIVRLAERVFETPLVMLALWDGDRHWCKARRGGLPVEVSADESPLPRLGQLPRLVDDATQDAQLASLSWVTGPLALRFFAAQALHAPDGTRVGALCVMDKRRRSIPRADRDILIDLAAMADAELATTELSRAQLEYLGSLSRDERSQATHPDTRLWRESAIEGIVERELGLGRTTSLALIALGLSDEGATPELSLAAERVRRVVRPCDALGHAGNGCFWLLLSDCDGERGARVAERVRANLTHTPLESSRDGVIPSIGLCSWDRSEPASALRARARERLAEARTLGGNRVVG